LDKNPILKQNLILVNPASNSHNSFLFSIDFLKRQMILSEIHWVPGFLNRYSSGDEKGGSDEGSAGMAVSLI